MKEGLRTQWVKRIWEAEGSRQAAMQERYSHIQLRHTTRTSGKTISISKSCLPEAVTVNKLPRHCSKSVEFHPQRTDPHRRTRPGHGALQGCRSLAGKSISIILALMGKQRAGRLELDSDRKARRPVCYAPPASFRLRGGEIVPKKM